MLNNHGLGTKEAVFMVCIILFCLLLAVYYAEVVSLSLGKENNTPKETKVEKYQSKKTEKNTVDKTEYIKYENKMIDATDRYLKFYEYELDGENLIIDLKTLVKFGFIENMVDVKDGSVCDGRSVVSGSSKNYSIKTYLDCSNYKTNG